MHDPLTNTIPLPTSKANQRLAATLAEIRRGCKVPDLDEAWPCSWPEQVVLLSVAQTAADAERFGEWAYSFGFGELQNPYQGGSLYHEGWLVGWLGAQEGCEG